MRLWQTQLPLLALALLLSSCQQAPPESSSAEEATEGEVDPTPGEVVASGIFLGRSGTPMADVQLVFGPLTVDWANKPSIVDLGLGARRTTTDAEGRFSIDSFEPGKYAVVYLPPDTVTVIPLEIDISVLAVSAESFAPLLVNVELGTDGAYEERPWSGDFTLMPGHTLYNKGRFVNAWNASVRFGSLGPYVELRRGDPVTLDLEDNGEIEIEAWSF